MANVLPIKIESDGLRYKDCLSDGDLSFEVVTSYRE